MMRTDVYERELRAAIELARRAGAAALEFYGEPLQIKYKGGNPGDPVTQADRVANELIVRGLRQSFPEDGVLAEESVDDAERRLGRERVWAVDPLDGTKGFIAGTGDFAVQIGLSERGESVLGVVFQPVPDLLYWAARGRGAWVLRPGFQPERLRVSERDERSGIRLAASRAHRSPKMDAVVRALGVDEEVRRDSVGVKVGLIAEQQCELYVHLSAGTKEWDTCAPEAILREAGGLMTDLWGEPLRYNSADVVNRNGLVATNWRLHPYVVSRLRPLLEQFGRTRVHD